MRSVSQVLVSILAPNLEDLAVAPMIYDDLAFLDFHITRKFTTHKSLTFAPDNSGAFEAFPLASKCFPMIEHLTLINIYASAFLSYFTNMDQNLFPNLKSLAMRNVDSRIEHDLKVVIASRKCAGHPLKTLCLDPASLSSLSAREWFEGELSVEERDDWLIRRQTALYVEDETLFEGTPDRPVM